MWLWFRWWSTVGGGDFVARACSIMLMRGVEAMGVDVSIVVVGCC